jgi:hypothetical protein
MEIEHKSKLFKSPGAATYKVSYAAVHERTKSGLMEKSEKVSYLDDLEWLSKNTPGFYEKKHTLTTEKSPRAIILPEKTNKSTLDPPKNSVGPASYKVQESYSQTQTARPKFFMSKLPLDNFVNQQVRMNRKVPGVGSYNVENVHKIVTSGLAKGWK